MDSSPIYTDTINGTSSGYCGIYGHVRVYAGLPETAPSTCHCGAMKYVKHRCVCGNEHEQQIPNKPYHGEVVARLLGV